MGHKPEDGDFCATTDFDFLAPDGQKRFYKDSCDVVDQEGTDAEFRFRAVQELGERLQAKRKTSKKHLRNIYQLVMQGIIKDYGFEDAHEPLLRSMLMVYWEHGHELREALEKPQLTDRKLTAQVDWEKACDRAERTQQPVVDEYPEPEIRILYSHSREAGPG